MKKLTRRSLLQSAPAVGLAALVPAAAVAEPERPWAKARRLARELSATLAECDDGTMMAEVYAAKGDRKSFMFIDAEWRDDTLRRLAAEPPPSPIMGMFREWQAKYERACAPTLPYQEVDSILDECRELERRMLAIPASSAGDFAAKLLAITSYGEYSLEDDAGGRFMAEARALAGLEAAAPTLNT